MIKLQIKESVECWNWEFSKHRMSKKLEVHDYDIWNLQGRQGVQTQINTNYRMMKIELVKWGI
jgi:hypothetical protein